MFFSAGYFFPRNQSAGYFLLKSPIPPTPPSPPPPQYHSSSFQLLVFVPFPLGKGTVVLPDKVCFVFSELICYSFCSFATA